MTTTSEPSQALPQAGAQVAPAEMRDIEARVAIVVDDPRASARELRVAVEDAQGTITSEVVQIDSAGRGSARVTLRVPVQRSQTLLAAIGRLGQVGLQQITARDVGKEYFDAGILLANLEAAQVRYQAILERAQNVKEVLEVEAQLGRVRGEIERVKGELLYLRDRAARATIHVALQSRPKAIVVNEQPKPAFYPGVRASYLHDLRGARGDFGYYGAGLTVRFSRAVSLDLDALRRVSGAAPGIDALLVTLGSDVYSAFASGGRRRFFNPYLGYRIGYARFPNAEDALALGAVAGVELLKTQAVSVEVDVTGTGFVGEGSPHFAVQPALSANFAF